jgi:hypothetical protein
MQRLFVAASLSTPVCRRTKRASTTARHAVRRTFDAATATRVRDFDSLDDLR